MSFYSYTNQTYNILKKEQVCIAFLYNTNLFFPFVFRFTGNKSALLTQQIVDKHNINS